MKPRDLLRPIRETHKPVVTLVLLLAGIGLVMQYSAGGGALRPFAFAQGIRLLPGIALMFVLALVPLPRLFRAAYGVYFLCLVLMVAVEIAGHIGMGAQRWIMLGPLTLQPSELMKLATILALARYLHHVHPHERPGPLTLGIPALLLLAPVALILKQPNLGTASILLMTGVCMLFAAGVRWIYFISAGVMAVVSAPIAWHFLHAYQKRRVLTFLDPEQDPLGAGYNIIQSIIAIGSGGFFGKGFLHGSQGQLDFLPEKQTDFIFTMLSEEFGFMGSALVVLAYALLILFTLAIARACRHRFGALVAVGVSSLLFLHVFINIGMSMGMLPVVGVPLPLLSYGGSILISTLIGFGLLLNVWANRGVALRPGSG